MQNYGYVIQSCSTSARNLDEYIKYAILGRTKQQYFSHLDILYKCTVISKYTIPIENNFLCNILLYIILLQLYQSHRLQQLHTVS